MILIEETDKRFYIKESTLPNAGFGLFAKEFLKKDDFLEIIGVQVPKNGISDQCTHFAGNYKFAALQKPGFDRLVVPLGYGGMINHVENESKRNVEMTNVNHNPRSDAGSSLVYVFLRDIEPDEELLGHYGVEWAFVFDWAGKNTKTDEEKVQLVKTDWETLLSYDLYNLNELVSRIYKE